MTYQEFIREFEPIMKVFGVETYPTMVLDLIHKKIKDLDRRQLKELIELVLMNCKFAPKVPDVLEYANIVRAKHRNGVRQTFPTDEGPRTEEVGRKALATLHEIFSGRNKV